MTLKLSGAEKRPIAPADFRKALAKNPKAKATWDSLTPLSQMDFITWIESPKIAATRDEHVVRACDMLSKGKRRPCCYSIVPMDLYKALAKNQKAKSQLNKLEPVEKRLFLSWVDSEKQTDARKVRVEKAIQLLIAGKNKI